MIYTFHFPGGGSIVTADEDEARDMAAHLTAKGSVFTLTSSDGETLADTTGTVVQLTRVTPRGTVTSTHRDRATAEELMAEIAFSRYAIRTVAGKSWMYEACQEPGCTRPGVPDGEFSHLHKVGYYTITPAAV